MATGKGAIATILPWTAGAGFAAGHMMLTSQCTLAALGVCTGCAGCAVALASLVGWGACKGEKPREKNTRDR